MAKSREFPFRVRPYEEEFQERVKRDFGEGFRKGFVKTNHWDFVLMGHTTEEMLQKCYNKTIQEGDVWVTSPPKCGKLAPLV